MRIRLVCLFLSALLFCFSTLSKAGAVADLLNATENGYALDLPMGNWIDMASDNRFMITANTRSSKTRKINGAAYFSISAKKQGIGGNHFRLLTFGVFPNECADQQGRLVTTTLDGSTLVETSDYMFGAGGLESDLAEKLCGIYSTIRTNKTTPHDMIVKKYLVEHYVRDLPMNEWIR